MTSFKTKFNFLFACEQKQKPNGNDLPAIQIPATLRSYYHTSSTTFPQCNKRTSSLALLLCMFGVSVHEDIIKGKKNAYLSLNFIKKKYYQHILPLLIYFNVILGTVLCGNVISFASNNNIMKDKFSVRDTHNKK